MKVSVCIPAYNAECWLAGCLDSVLAQTEQDIEVVVWDDGSTDATLSIATGYAARDLRVVVGHSRENRGAADGYNHCVAMALADVVLLMGSDDRLKPEYVSRTISALESTGAGLVTTDVETFGGKWNGLRFSGNKSREQLREFFYKANFLMGGHLMRRETYIDLGGMFGEFGHMADLELLIRIVSRHDLHVVDEPLYLYRVRSNSISQNLDEKNHKEISLAIHRKHYRWRSVDGQLVRQQ